MGVLKWLLSVIFITIIQLQNITEHYNDLEEAWSVSKIMNFKPPYSIIGEVTNDWNIVPTVPFNDYQSCHYEAPNKKTLEIYAREHFHHNFMSISRPDPYKFAFKRPIESMSEPPANCMYPSIPKIVQEYTFENQINILTLTKIFKK
ncbi:hypothetical protein MXB_4850, partial [Myxobolus squamalis]